MKKQYGAYLMVDGATVGARCNGERVRLRRATNFVPGPDHSFTAAFLAINGGRIDLAAEIVSAMTYVGLTDHPDYLPGIDYLLDTQNESGSWGSYEHLRPTQGDLVEQRLYLHTTSVALTALIEAFDGGWPGSGRETLAAEDVLHGAADAALEALGQ